MIITCILLTLMLLATSTTLFFSIKKNLEFLQQQENVLETLEKSLQELEVCYKRIDKKTKLELFSDDATIKEMVDDMKAARSAVALIIENLTGEKEAIDAREESTQ